jgi:hypothetical protein
VSTEQEYESQADMIDDQDPNDIAGPGPYPQNFASQQVPTNQAQHHVHQQQPMGGHQQQLAQVGDNGPGFASMTQLLDPYDPMLDMDPFGLSASMHFPTQFSFDTSSMR